jgi:signal transduction histidine kinase
MSGPSPAGTRSATTAAARRGLAGWWRWLTEPAYGAEPVAPFTAYTVAQGFGVAIWFAYFFTGGAGESRFVNVLSTALIVALMAAWLLAAAKARHNREQLFRLWSGWLPAGVAVLGVTMFADGLRVTVLPYVSVAYIVIASLMFQPRYTIALACLAAIAPALRHSWWNMVMDLDPVPYATAAVNPVMLIAAGYIAAARTRADERLRRNLAEANERLAAQAASLQQALEVARLGELRFRAFSDHAPVALALFDEQGRPTFRNAFARQVFGTPSAAQFDEDEYARVQACIGAAANEGRTSTLDYRQRDRDGRLRHLSGVFFPVEGSGAGAIVLDVTRERALALQAMRVQQAETLGTLTGGIAHDFNNLLTVILGNLYLIETELPEGSPAKPLLNDIRLAGERGAELVQRLLLYARPSVERWETVDLGTLLAEATRLVRPAMDRTSLTVEYPATPCYVRGDFASLEQVLMNLLLNARDAVAGGGAVDVRVETRDLAGDEPMADGPSLAGRFHVISIHDSGPGIPPDVLPRIFDPFFTTKEVGKGTGLGLTTSAAMVRAHGGALDVETAAGEGTTFRVFLPAYEAEVAGATA